MCPLAKNKKRCFFFPSKIRLLTLMLYSSSPSLCLSVLQGWCRLIGASYTHGCCLFLIKCMQAWNAHISILVFRCVSPKHINFLHFVGLCGKQAVGVIWPVNFSALRGTILSFVLLAGIMIHTLCYLASNFLICSYLHWSLYARICSSRWSKKLRRR